MQTVLVMSAFSTRALEEKISRLSLSQDSIETLSLWITQYKAHANDTVQVWLEEIKKANADMRLLLFYLANDILQNSRRRGADNFLDIFQDPLRHAVTLIGGQKIQTSIERMFRIWKERRVYSNAFLKELEMLIEPVRKTQVNEALPDFKLPLLQDALSEFAKFEAELKVKSSHLSNLRVDISNPTASLAMLKDKSAGGRVSQYFEEASQKLQDYCECLGVEVNERINILDMLKECKIFTAYRQAELQRISTDYKSLDKSVKDVMEKMDQRMKDLDRANSTSTSDPSARDDITDVGDMEIESDGEGQDSKSQSNPPGMILTPPMATTYQAGPMQPSPPTIAYQEQAPPLSSGQHMASPALRARLEGPRFQGRGVAGPPQPGRGSVMTRPLPPPGRGMTTRPLLPPARGVARPLPPPARGMVRPLPPPARGMVRPLPSPVRGMARPLPPPVRGMARPLPPQGRGPTRPLPPQGRGMARPLPPHQRPPLQGQNGNSSPVQPAHGHRTMPPFRVPPIIKPGPPEANQSHTISSNAVMYNRPNQPEATAMEENSTPDHVKPSLDERLKDMLLNKKFEGTVLKEQDDSKAYSPTEHDHTLVNTDGEMSPAPTPSPVDSPETSPKPNMDNPILKALYKSRASPEPKPSSLVPDYDENDELSSSDLKNILNQVISSEPSNTRSDGVEQPPPASGPEKPAIPTPSDIKITPTLTNLLDEIFPKISQSLMNRKRKQESDNIPSKISRLDEGGPGLPSKISHPGNVSRLDGPPGLPGNISRLDAPPGLPGNVSRLDGPPGLPGNVSRLDGPPRLPGNVSRLDGPPGLPGNVSRLDGPPRLPGNVSRLDGPPGLPGNVSRLDGPPGLPGNVSRLDGPYPPPPPPPPPQQTPLFPGSPRVRSPFERPRFPLYPPGGPMHMPKQGVGPPRPRLFSPYERVPSNHLMENSQGQHFSMRPNSYQEPRLYNPAMRPRGYGQFHPRFV